MRHVFTGLMLLGLAASGVWLCSASVDAESERAPTSGQQAAPAANPSRLPKRVPFNGSRVNGAPGPPAPCITQSAFPKLKFYEPLAMTTIPGTDRLVIAERKGKIFSFANDRQTDQQELLIDLEKTVYGVTFHPKYHSNGYVYVTYIVDPEKPSPQGSRLSRFQSKPDDRLHVDKTSEQVILEWPSGGHNGGCIAFGPDGFLYLTTGDGSGIADELQTGQNVGDLLAAILRIDVDHQAGGKNYAVPKDNPFVNTPDARPEIWAYGLRQAWKFSFDRQSGEMWAGEVGQDLWEMVYKIEKGGNYGWSVSEGTHPFRPERKLGPTPILKPVIEHPHSDFRSITGGFVYRGSRLKDLVGAYVYGDYDTGKIASLRYDGGKLTAATELVDTPLRIVTFGEDAAGEIYIVDFIGGGLHLLAPAPKAEPVADFPRRLSDTGLFADTASHQPAPGVIPYSVNSELWSDGAIKSRFIALPGDAKIEFETVEYPQPAPGAPRGWRFPNGAVIVKTFSLEMEPGNPESRRRLETRLLHVERTPGTEEVGDQVWRGYTYVWNDAQTDADLLDKQGLDRTYTIRDPNVAGGKRQQTWHFPSRAECTLCHTMPAKYVLGLNTLQLNKDHQYDGVSLNQLDAFQQMGLFHEPLPVTPDKLPRLVDHKNPQQNLDRRARSYLHSNCSHCHMKWGGGNAEFQLLATLPLSETGTLNVRPGHGGFEIDRPGIIVPGDPARSMIAFRMAKLGLGRMPHIASSIVDEQAVKLIGEWIRELK